MGWGIKRFAVGMLTVAVAAMVFAGVAQGASVHLKPVDTVPMPSFGSWGGYTVAPNGTYWTVRQTSTSGGIVQHLGDEGNNLGDDFNISAPGGFYPLSIGYYGGRVYITTAATSGSTTLTSYLTGPGGTNPGLRQSDADTGYRIGTLGAFIRIASNGVAAIAFGQAGKVATLDITNLATAHPFYPQIFMGAGINDITGQQTAFQSCSAGNGAVGGSHGTPGNCGRQYGRGGPNVGELNYPLDVAFGNNGLFVAEDGGDRITHIRMESPGPDADYAIGSKSGSGASQLSHPQSVVRQGSTANLFISEVGNGRISVFTSGGRYIASFGYGVRNGSDKFQACGVGIGKCRAAVPYTTDARAYYTRLDLDSDGDLRAFMPLAGEVQIFSLNGGHSSSKDKVSIKADPLKVKKGRRTKLTATVKPAKTCGSRGVLFQVRDGRSWDNLGGKRDVGKDCSVSTRPKIKDRSVFRAISLGASHNTIATSQEVTVKLK
jgi:hypothetical protein